MMSRGGGQGRGGQGLAIGRFRGREIAGQVRQQTASKRCGGYAAATPSTMRRMRASTPLRISGS